jgi:hypothetical protein
MNELITTQTKKMKTKQLSSCGHHWQASVELCQDSGKYYINSWYGDTDYAHDIWWEFDDELERDETAEPCEYNVWCFECEAEAATALEKVFSKLYPSCEAWAKKNPIIEKDV